MNVCSICGKKINGINNAANNVGKLVICSHCLDKLNGFKYTRKYKNVEELEEDREKVLETIKELNWSEENIQLLNQFLDQKKREIINLEEMDSYMMTTTNGFERYEIEKYLGVVSGQVVAGSGFMSGLNESIANFTGGEADMFSERLDQAKKVAQYRAIIKAMKLGANALVGVDVEFTTFSQNMMGCIVTGTAVKIKERG